MKNNFFLLSLALLSACAEQPPMPYPAYEFDLTAYALQQGWDKVNVEGVGVAYDDQGNAYVVTP